jgi:hypothetical protein
MQQQQQQQQFHLAVTLSLLVRLESIFRANSKSSACKKSKRNVTKSLGVKRSDAGATSTG